MLTPIANRYLFKNFSLTTIRSHAVKHDLLLMGTSILLIWFDFYLGDSGELDAYDIIIEILWRLDGKASILFVGGFPVSLRHLKLLPDENFHDSQLPDQVTD